MRLEIGSVAVSEVALGARTALDGHTLVVDAAAVREVVLEDPRFADVQVHVVQPGDDVRVIHAVDVVEPRWKIEGPEYHELGRHFDLHGAKAETLGQLAGALREGLAAMKDGKASILNVVLNA